MARITPVSFATLFIFFCLQGKVSSAVTSLDACSSISTVSQHFSPCFSILSSLNKTIHTHEQICQMYNEAVNCLRKKIIKDGQSCDINNIQVTMTTYGSHSPWLKNYQVQSCHVTELSESICSSPERLGLVSLITCARAIIGGFASHSGFVCSTISSLDACTDTFLFMLEDQHCTRDDIKNGLTSSVAQKWLSSNYPTIDLEQCFTVYQPGLTSNDYECSNFQYISRHTQQAMGVMFTNNMTAMGGQHTWCRTYYYALHLLQHEMEALGHVCLIDDLEKQMSNLLGYHGVSGDILHTCQGQMSITPAEFCSDPKTVLKIMAHEPYCKGFVRQMVSSTDDRKTCMNLLQFNACAETKLKYAGFQCDSSVVFAKDNLAQYMADNYHITLPTCS